MKSIITPTILGGDTMNTKRIALSGVLAALIFVATYLIRIPIPATEGYINLGDAAILMCSFVLGPFAAIPAAIGSGLSDLLAGYAHYIIPTVMIKGTMGLIAGYILSRKSTLPIRLVSFITAEIIMVGGYFAYETLIYGFAAAAAGVPFNAIQGAAGITIATALSFVSFFKKRDNMLLEANNR